MIGGVPEIRQGGGVVELLLEFGDREFISDVDDDTKSGGSLGSGVAKDTSNESFELRRVVEQLFNECGPRGPLVLFAVVVK